ncbi:competence protein CoiA [Ferrovibrio sp.]|uniref:competence protein CoiA n=1 Tax=Ferrovibrio sp. TaxID=1917215 RepID=UPI003D1159C8
MKFALVNGNRIPPAPKHKGICACCAGELIAKCGRVKLWHWAHKRKFSCDPWWENETEWHRRWKNQFPAEWQEVVHFDVRAGERHIADVKCSSGLVVEFQNSPMSYEELRTREQFYGDMIWIVNGLRGDLDESYFRMGLGRTPIQNSPLAYGIAWWGRSRLLHNWSLSEKRVFLDFGDAFTLGPPVVWRLVYYDREQKCGAVAPYPKQLLVQSIIDGEEIGVPCLPVADSSETVLEEQP